ncbi:MAG: GNAT family N-acetyltransferase [Burkholderiales bacterium]|nr:GNAT family N-acetyltransferase [Burkholderiales bacterium]
MKDQDQPPEPSGAPRTIIYRHWQDGDSPEELTELLHRAFAHLAEMGLRCASAYQPPEGTLARLLQGCSFVAVDNGRLVGAISVYHPEFDSDSSVYRERGVASVHQFGVDPAYQGFGVGDALLRLAECEAKRQGYTALALDTPEPAQHLHRFYMHMGFSIVESLRFAGREYLSVVLKKHLDARAGLAPALAWL